MRGGPPVFQRLCKCVVTVYTATASVQWDAHCIFWCANFKSVVNIQRKFSAFFTEPNLEVPDRFLGDFSQLKGTKDWKKSHLEGCRFKESCLMQNGIFLRVQTSPSFVAVLKPMWAVLRSKMCYVKRWHIMFTEFKWDVKGNERKTPIFQTKCTMEISPQITLMKSFLTCILYFKWRSYVNMTKCRLWGVHYTYKVDYLHHAPPPSDWWCDVHWATWHSVFLHTATPTEIFISVC